MEVAPGAEAACHACSRPFRDAAPGTPPPQEGLSAHGRYACPAGAHDFCAECDVFVHDVLHCCPGCGK
jgi:transcription initiation factor TFIIH subunit 2